MGGINLLPEDLLKICRSCLNKNGVHNLLTYEHDGILLRDIFLMIVTIRVEMNERFPKSLCEDCTNTILEFFKFKKRLESSENILSNLEINLNELKNTIEKCQSADENRNLQKNLNVGQEEHKTVTHKEHKKKLKGILCNFCFLTFDSYELYSIHRKKEAEQRRKQDHCTICNKLVVTYKLKDHINSHTKECPYKCEFCGEKFRYRSSLSRHKYRHRDKKPHECNICGKGFIQAPALKDHLRTHSGKKSFICNVCGKCFITKHALGNHIYMHKNIQVGKKLNNNFCQKCNLKFTSKLKWKDHMLTHNNKDFLCSICGKKFSQKSLLDSHFKVHSVIKSFVCFHCKKAFSEKNTLQKHVLIHGNKSIVCFICGKGFFLKSQLNSHMRKHSGERPYNCPYCIKAFSHSTSLKIHIRTHSGEKPYVCEFCSKGFPDSSGLKKHIKKHETFINNNCKSYNIDSVKDILM